MAPASQLAAEFHLKWVPTKLVYQDSHKRRTSISQ
jgi:hypothetical protein